MEISSARLPAATVTPKVRDALQATLNARKAAVSQLADGIRKSRFAASDMAKSQARAKLQEIGERVRIIKKLFSGNPKEMARALAQIFKELKAAVRAYKAATGDEFKMAGDPSVAAAAGSAAQADQAPKDGDTKDPESDADTKTSSADGAAIYSAATQDLREGIGADALDFAKSVRELSNKLQELLETARGQAKIRKPSKETDKALEEADKTLAELRDDLHSMEADVRMEAPTLGLRLSVAA